ncbi:hypothetical protein C0992_005737 [Termitomyces sp. T32_za158]|nr:hypothetical protein C0992_005737 [Termitomyces sp. T32_za158]
MAGPRARPQKLQAKTQDRGGSGDDGPTSAAPVTQLLAPDPGATLLTKPPLLRGTPVCRPPPPKAPSSWPSLPDPLPVLAASTGCPPHPPEPRAALDVQHARVATGCAQALPCLAHALFGSAPPLALKSARDLCPTPAAAPPPPNPAPPPPPVTPPANFAKLQPPTGDAQTGAKRCATPRDPPWQQATQETPDDASA